MKLSTLTPFFTSLLFVAFCNGQNNSTDDFEYSLESAHPKARALMTEDFFWSPIEESGPFGSDDGRDAAYAFRSWRFENRLKSPLTFLKELIEHWHYPPFDWNESDTSKIKKILNSDDGPMSTNFLVGQDNAIIGTGFAQFALEGSVDKKLKQLTITAIKRQLLPILINIYPSSEYRSKRKYQLNKMLEVISKANS